MTLDLILLAHATLPARVKCTPQLALAPESLAARARCTPQLALAHETLQALVMTGSTGMSALCNDGGISSSGWWEKRRKKAQIDSRTAITCSS